MIACTPACTRKVQAMSFRVILWRVSDRMRETPITAWVCVTCWKCVCLAFPDNHRPREGLVERTGIDPATSRVRFWRSTKLRYRPVSRSCAGLLTPTQIIFLPDSDVRVKPLRAESAVRKTWAVPLHGSACTCRRDRNLTAR